MNPRFDHGFDVSQGGWDVERLIRMKLGGRGWKNTAPIDLHETVLCNLKKNSIGD